MTLHERTALEESIQLLLVPSLARTLHPLPLPHDIDILLLVLARDAEAEAHATAVSGRSVEVVREGAEFYASQILFSPHASAYRALACEPGAAREQLRSKFALLLRWLHPAYGVGSEQHYYDRVLSAWNILGSAERRRAYDSRLIAVQAGSAILVPASSVMIQRAPFFSTHGMAHPVSSRRRTRLRRSVQISALVALSLVATLLVADPPQWITNALNYYAFLSDGHE